MTLDSIILFIYSIILELPLETGRNLFTITGLGKYNLRHLEWSKNNIRITANFKIDWTSPV